MESESNRGRKGTIAKERMWREIDRGRGEREAMNQVGSEERGRGIGRTERGGREGR